MIHTRILAVLLITGFLLVPISSANAGLLLSEKDRAKLEQSANKDNGVNGRWLMTYYVGYQNKYLKPKDVDYSLMTHVAVGAVGVNADGSLREHWFLDNGDGRAMAEDVGRRAKKAGVKTLMWLGGPNEQDKFLSATSDINRAKFIKNIVSLVRDLGYKGVDVNWEPIRKAEEQQVLTFLKELRAAAPDFIITLPVNWVPTTILAIKDLSVYKEYAKYVDRMFIMSYSMAGPWPGWQVWHGGALSGDTLTTPGSVQTSVIAYERADVPKEKLGIGIGTYATCWEYPVRRPEQTVPYNFSPSDIGEMTTRKMMEDYYNRKYEKWDASAQVPYLSFPKAKGEWDCGYISYENERSIKAKMEYVKKEELGGAIVWNIGTGYYPDKSRARRNPLLKAAWDSLK